jgi:6-phosphogluconolactonase
MNTPSIFLAALTALASTSFGGEVRLWFGTYTNANNGSKGIYTSTLDTDTGKLAAPVLAGEAKSPSFLALSPNGKNLYAALEDGGGSVGAFSVAANGLLKSLGTESAGGGGTCHVWVDATGRTVLAANYGGGSVASFLTKPDGSIEKRATFIQHRGSGPNKQRQEKPHAHSIYTNAANSLVYSCDLGTDDVFIYKLDAATATLTPNTPASGRVPAGGGPRHFGIHPNGKFAYANNEMTLSVTAFSVNAADGGLTELQTLPTLPEGADAKGASTAELFCRPDGKFVYVSNRGHDSITVYSVGPDGKLTFVQNETTRPAGVPRGFAISPDGRWLVAAGQSTGKVVVFKIDADSGKLSPTGQVVDVPASVCVIFAK